SYSPTGRRSAGPTPACATRRPAWAPASSSRTWPPATAFRGTTRRGWPPPTTRSSAVRTEETGHGDDRRGEGRARPAVGDEAVLPQGRDGLDAALRRRLAPERRAPR